MSSELLCTPVPDESFRSDVPEDRRIHSRWGGRRRGTSGQISLDTPRELSSSSTSSLPLPIRAPLGIPSYTSTARQTEIPISPQLSPILRTVEVDEVDRGAMAANLIMNLSAPATSSRHPPVPRPAVPTPPLLNSEGELNVGLVGTPLVGYAVMSKQFHLQQKYKEVVKEAGAEVQRFAWHARADKHHWAEERDIIRYVREDLPLSIRVEQARVGWMGLNPRRLNPVTAAADSVVARRYAQMVAARLSLHGNSLTSIPCPFTDPVWERPAFSNFLNGCLRIRMLGTAPLDAEVMKPFPKQQYPSLAWFSANASGTRICCEGVCRKEGHVVVKLSQTTAPIGTWRLSQTEVSRGAPGHLFKTYVLLREEDPPLVGYNEDVIAITNHRQALSIVHDVAASEMGPEDGDMVHFNIGLGWKAGITAVDDEARSIFNGSQAGEMTEEDPFLSDETQISSESTLVNPMQKEDADPFRIRNALHPPSPFEEDRYCGSYYRAQTGVGFQQTANGDSSPCCICGETMSLQGEGRSCENCLDAVDLSARSAVNRLVDTDAGGTEDFPIPLISTRTSSTQLPIQSISSHTSSTSSSTGKLLPLRLSMVSSSRSTSVDLSPPPNTPTSVVSLDTFENTPPPLATHLNLLHSRLLLIKEQNLKQGVKKCEVQHPDSKLELTAGQQLPALAVGNRKKWKPKCSVTRELEELEDSVRREVVGSQTLNPSAELERPPPKDEDEVLRLRNTVGTPMQAEPEERVVVRPAIAKRKAAPKRQQGARVVKTRTAAPKRRAAPKVATSWKDRVLQLRDNSKPMIFVASAVAVMWLPLWRCCFVLLILAMFSVHSVVGYQGGMDFVDFLPRTETQPPPSDGEELEVELPQFPHCPIDEGLLELERRKHYDYVMSHPVCLEGMAVADRLTQQFLEEKGMSTPSSAQTPTSNVWEDFRVMNDGDDDGDEPAPRLARDKVMAKDQVAPPDQGSNRTYVAYKKNKKGGGQVWLPTMALWDSGNGSGRHVAYNNLFNDGLIADLGRMEEVVELRSVDGKTLIGRCGFGSQHCPDARVAARLWCSETHVAGFNEKREWRKFDDNQLRIPVFGVTIPTFPGSPVEPYLHGPPKGVNFTFCEIHTSKVVLDKVPYNPAPWLFRRDGPLFGKRMMGSVRYMMDDRRGCIDIDLVGADAKKSLSTTRLSIPVTPWSLHNPEYSIIGDAQQEVPLAAKVGDALDPKAADFVPKNTQAAPIDLGSVFKGLVADPDRARSMLESILSKGADADLTAGRRSSCTSRRPSCTAGSPRETTSSFSRTSDTAGRLPDATFGVRGDRGDTVGTVSGGLCCSRLFRLPFF